MPLILSKRDTTSESNGIEPVWLTVAILLPIFLSAFLLWLCYRCDRADQEFRVRGVAVPQYVQNIPGSSTVVVPC